MLVGEEGLVERVVRLDLVGVLASDDVDLESGSVVVLDALERELLELSGNSLVVVALHHPHAGQLAYTPVGVRAHSYERQTPVVDEARGLHEGPVAPEREDVAVLVGGEHSALLELELPRHLHVVP